MDESRFHAVADALLAGLMDRIEEALGDEAEVDLQGGVLTVELDDGRQFVINKHAPNRQVWLSSPLGGAFHFDLDEASGDWLSTRDRSLTLTAVLARDLAAATGRAVRL